MSMQEAQRRAGETMTEAYRLYMIGCKDLAFWTAKPAINERITKAEFYAFMEFHAVETQI